MATPMLRMPWGELLAWSGPWPPPETLLMCIGRRTGGRVFTTLEQIEEKGEDPDESDENPHVLRGAEYEEVGP
jgi:hypothetical protein